ncbi:hypothetical protein HPMG_01471 [Helicobacter pullorum MIT 98-5489]|uniref:Uncharacterized protein n=1 Tax=Helicobacter pullorum MIT 98-5489 TaxID=537972 RepID=C5F1S0_9HELI|nr:hypothetical protein HPMG_01471 [Helicobacter pullorum MIT 98-5489]
MALQNRIQSTNEQLTKTKFWIYCNAPNKNKQMPQKFIFYNRY